MRRLVMAAVAVLLLASAVEAQVPNRLADVEAVAAADHARFLCAHTAAACAYDFIEALVCRLNPDGSGPWGLNGKRGNPNEVSWDAINYRGVGPAIDPGSGQRVTVIDVIAAAGSSSARPSWQTFDDPTPGYWLAPRNCGAVSGGGPSPTPSPAGTGGASTPDTAALLAVLDRQLDVLNTLHGDLWQILAALNYTNERVAAIEQNTGRTAAVQENLVAAGSWMASYQTLLVELRQAVERRR